MFALLLAVLIDGLRLLWHHIIDILVVVAFKLGFDLIITISSVLLSILHLAQVVNHLAADWRVVRDVVLEGLHAIVIEFVLIHRLVV
jgi:hypothetical protein